MPITVKVQPDLSAFRQATVDEIAEVLHDNRADICTSRDIACILLRHYTILNPQHYRAPRTGEEVEAIHGNPKWAHLLDNMWLPVDTAPGGVDSWTDHL